MQYWRQFSCINFIIITQVFSCELYQIKFRKNMIEDVHLTCIIVGIVQGIYTDVIKWIFYQIKFDRAWLGTYVVVIIVTLVVCRSGDCTACVWDWQLKKKKNVWSKFWKLLKYIIGTGIDREIKWMFKEARENNISKHMDF